MHHLLCLTFALVVGPVSGQYSHICEDPANYLPNHVVGGGSTSCDAGIASASASGQALAGEDFSSTYDCASKSDAIKTMVNTIAASGCCGGNSNGKAIVVFGCLVDLFICLYICILTYFFIFYYSKETRNLPAGWITAITATSVKMPPIIFPII